MRRVLIDERITNIAQIFAERIKEIEATKAVSPNAGLKKLESKLKRSSIKCKVELLKYVEYLLDGDNYSRIIKATPDEMLNLIHEFESILPHKDLAKLRFGGKKGKFFHELLVSALRYDIVQSQIYPVLMRELGIKVCIYCNASLAIEYTRIPNKLKPKESSIVCRYELDHFYPKSYYPFLATSFYNLLPVCGTCNQNKSKKEALFNLYTTRESEVEVFNFELASGCMARYMMSFDENQIEIKLKPENTELTRNHQELFGIDGLYKTQKDVVAEIIIRALAYPQSRKNQLIKDYPRLKLKRDFVDRVVAGNYLAPTDVHLRPLAKLYSDIWYQVYGKRGI